MSLGSQTIFPSLSTSLNTSSCSRDGGSNCTVNPHCMSLVASPARHARPLSLTCNDVPVSVLHSVLVLLSRVPGCRLSFKEALEERGSDTKKGTEGS